jgi:hypothetical protein
MICQICNAQYKKAVLMIAGNTVLESVFTLYQGFSAFQDLGLHQPSLSTRGLPDYKLGRFIETHDILLEMLLMLLHISAVYKIQFDDFMLAYAVFRWAQKSRKTFK